MSVFAFGPFVLDVGDRLVREGDRRIAVSGKTFDVLRLLVEAQGRLVDRDTFNRKLWPDITVEERNLTVHVSTLRRLLNEGGAAVDYIETVSRSGYRLAVPVRVVSPAAAATAHPHAMPETCLLEAEARVH